MSFLLTLTKKAKNRRIKRNFIKNIFRAALSRAGYCLGHGLGLHLLPRQFHLPSFPGNIGHKSSLPVFPVNSSQQNRPAPEAVFPPEASPVFSASTAPHFQCHSRNPENTVLYNDKEYEGNLIYLLKSGSEFIRNNSKVRFVKEAQYRVDKPDYAERAVTEALVNALIHRDYIVLGSEVHIDMFDDRVEITSPGGMFGGGSIQEYDIYSIRSMR